MTDANDLAVLIDGAAEPEAVEAPPEMPAETGQTPGTPVDDTDAADKGETTAETAEDAPPASEPEAPEQPKMVPHEALGEARAKNRQLQSQLQQMQADLDRLKNPAPPAPDVFEDPEGYQAHQEHALQVRLFNERASTSVALVQQEHGEESYQEAEALFAEAVGQNPILAETLRTHPLPGHFVWQTAQTLKAQAEIGDPATYRERVRQEVMAEMQGGVEKMVADQVKAALSNTLPSSLASEKADGNRTSQPVWTGPAPLSSLIPE